MKLSFFICSSFLSYVLFAQPNNVEKILSNKIKTVQLYTQNNQNSLPIINLGSSDLLELHFDDLDGFVKNYYYTFQLCNENWEEATLSPFDYIKGFTQNRITQYRVSSISQTRYVHYTALLPEKNSIPTKSGNYLLKVFLNGNPNDIVFAKKFFVVEQKATIAAQILQSFDNSLFRTHQKVQLSVNATQLNPINPQQQIKINVLQNNRWDNIVRNIVPAFIRGTILEYNGEQDCLFEGGKEYRWVDLRSFRFESERVQSIVKTSQPNEIFVKPDGERNRMGYSFWRDLNGWYSIATTENVNPFWQTDYANVHFTYVTEDNKPYYKKDVYLVGAFTNGVLDESNKLIFNEEKGAYEITKLLKQGYYTYTYVTKENNPKKMADVAITDGNYWETENDYTIFVYYRSLSARHDELVGITSINSRLNIR